MGAVGSRVSFSGLSETTVHLEEDYVSVDERHWLVEARACAVFDGKHGDAPSRVRLAADVLCVRSSALLSITYDFALTSVLYRPQLRATAIVIMLSSRGPGRGGARRSALATPGVLRHLVSYLCNPEAVGLRGPAAAERPKRKWWGHWQPRYLPQTARPALTLKTVCVQQVDLPGQNVGSDWTLDVNPGMHAPPRSRGRRMVQLQDRRATVPPAVLPFECLVWRDGWHRLRVDFDGLPLILPQRFDRTNSALIVTGADHRVNVSFRQTRAPTRPVAPPVDVVVSEGIQQQE
eukprot:TRINITY_DN1161_c6_g2_i1.p1 TRINITY_DN1161_c6_g2~~TRINITY_DN1161_c6_g2_i1.p1  ORF type:complete len:334 (+),score=32.88 TRINITY_DN1161_c6_g2_i1:131-1003(+)